MNVFLLSSRYRLSATVILLVLSGGCAGLLDFRPQIGVAFQATDGLAVGSPVVLNGEQIGTVRTIDSQNRPVRVMLAIDRERLARIQANAAAMIVQQRQGTTTVHVVEIYNPRTASAPVQAGATLKGLNSVWEKTAWNLGDTLGGDWRQALSQTLESVSASIDTALSGPEAQRARQTVTEMTTALKEGSSKALESARAQCDQLMAELDAKAAQLRREGQTAKADALERLRSGLATVRERLATTK